MITELWQALFEVRAPTFWEALITSYTGIWAFIGVVVTLGFNGYLQRRQFVRSNEHEAKTVRRAIYAEIKTLVGVAKKRPDFFNEAPVRVSILEAMRIEVPIFDALAPKIGAFSTKEGEAIIWAYGSLKALRTTEEVLYKEWQSQDEAHRKLIVDRPHPNISESYNKLVGRLEDAIVAIEKGGV